MQIELSLKNFFIFDLDDTLVSEYDFLSSGFRHIAQMLESSIGENIAGQMLHRYDNGENVFEWICKEYSQRVPGLTKHMLLTSYREHMPSLALSPGASSFLESCMSRRIPLGLITDGRSITQRNKLRAAGIENIFRALIISEEFGSSKPAADNYLYFEKKFPGYQFWYFGDNTAKDFIVPLELGWRCVCLLDRGKNIHKQDLNKLKGIDPVTSFDDIRFATAGVAAY